MNNQFSVSGSVTSNSSGSIVWSLSDTSIDLSRTSLTPTNITFTVLRDQPSANIISYLVLPPNTLSPRLSLILTFTCYPQFGDAVSSNINIVTNGPPLPGQFIANPSSGLALNTSFQFSVSEWSDEDLPLTCKQIY